MVTGLFRHGCYVRTGSGIYAVAGPEVSAGPIHLVLGQAPPLLREGSVVGRDGGLLRMSGWEVDLARARTYRPARPGPGELRAAAGPMAVVRRGLRVPADLAGRWPLVRRAAAADDLLAVRRLLEGRGGGLTPTGDDVLAGMMLVRAWSGEPPVWLETVAGQSRTTDLSRAFLVWAARGQSLALVHDLMAQAACGDESRVRRTADDVAGIGASSGVALLWGLCLAVEALSQSLSPGAGGAAPRP